MEVSNFVSSACFHYKRKAKKRFVKKLLWGWSWEVSYPWSIWWSQRSFRFYLNRLEVTFFKKWLQIAIHVVLIASIFNWVQFIKYTKAKRCSADPMGPRMFSRPNPFGKWLISLESIFKIFITYISDDFSKNRGEDEVIWILWPWQ